MLWTFVVAATLAAPKAAPPPKLAAPGLSGLNVPAQELEFYSEHFAQQLTLAGLQVITGKQISSLLGLERQKQLLGCTEASSACMAELASALGVDGVVTGSVGKLEKSYRVNVSIVAAIDGRTLSAHSGRAGTSEELVEELTSAAQRMAGEATRALRGEAAANELQVPRPRPPNVRPVAEPAPAAEGWRLRPYAWLPAASGGVAAALGTLFAVQAGSKYGQLSAWRTGAPMPSYDEVVVVARDGATAQTIAIGTYAAGGLLLGMAGYMFLTGSPPAPGNARLVPAPGGAGLVWSWP